MQRLALYCKTLFTLAACVARVSVAGRATVVPKEIKRVCVVQTAKMGDMVCTTPMFRALKANYPNVEVYVVGDKINKEILAGNIDVAGYVVWSGDYRTLKKELQSLHIDFVCLTTPHLFVLAALLLSGIKGIAAPKVINGWSPLETAGYKLLRRFVLEVPHVMGQYAPRHYLRLLEPLGIHTDDTTKHLAYSPEAAVKVEAFLAQHNLAGSAFAIISPSAGNKIKRWPARRFAELAEHLVHKGVPVVVIGGKRDKEEVGDMFAALQSNEAIVDASEQFTIDELKACISRARLFVSVDTGPIYIAEAFGVPTVDITGPIDEHEQPPIGPLHKVVVPQERTKPQLYVLNAHVYDEAEVRRQTESITTAQVIKEIDALLALTYEPNH